jgi:transposase-like protein
MIISMYARGMSVREIQGHLRELYGIETSPQLISAVTDAVLEEVGRWQSRPLDLSYTLVFFDEVFTDRQYWMDARPTGRNNSPNAARIPH